LEKTKAVSTLISVYMRHGSETWTVKAKDARRITAEEIKYTRRIAGYI
jgi:hypothetical protein